MNFDKLKEALNKDASLEENTDLTIDLGKKKNNPVAAIRRNMRTEIFAQLIGIMVFLAAPFTFIHLDDKPKAIYLIFMFIASIMIMVYTIRLSLFLKAVDPMTLSTRNAIQSFIYEAQMTLQIYKSFVLASTLTVPVAIFALMTGNKEGQFYNPALFEKWLFLEISGLELTLLITGYLLLSAGFYYLTIGWTKFMYGQHLNILNRLLQNLSLEEA